MRERAQAYLDQGKTVYAAALMLKLVETDPTPENLTLLADVYLRQGLFDHAKELYLRVVKMGIETKSLTREETLQ
jgi:pentatricopeptide repeat protein